MFLGYLFLKFQKNRSQKLSMLKPKQGQIWDLKSALNFAQSHEAKFLIFVLLFLWLKIF